jgi:hypothetical protein
MAAETLERLVRRRPGCRRTAPAAGPAFALRPAQPGRGFDLLPAPDPGDVFYDIEGDPFFEGGLEYLHGLWAPDTGFRAIWAHDREAERAALAAVLDAFRTRIAAHPGARIYHYAAYEITALRRLTALHGARRGLPRPAAARAALRRSLRGRARRHPRLRAGLFDQVARGLHRHRARGRGHDRRRLGRRLRALAREGRPAILDEIEEYNRIDCVSTEKLRDWLVAIRPDVPWPALAEDAGREGDRGGRGGGRAPGAAGGLEPRSEASGCSSTSASSTGVRRSRPGGRSSTASARTPTR